MVEIELVVKIDEDTYKDIKRGKVYSSIRDVPQESVLAIANGTPLPKGHGRLCDLDAALKCVDDDSLGPCDAKWQAIRLFDWAMAKRVVIEADKEITDETDN